MYHISQQACNALLVNMLKAGRWLSYLPASTSHLPAIYHKSTINLYAFLRCGSSDAPMLTMSTARMMQSEATASISTHS